MSLLLCPDSLSDRSSDDGPADWSLKRAPESYLESWRRSCRSRSARCLASSPGPAPEAPWCLPTLCCPSWAPLGGHCCAGFAGGSPRPLPKPTLPEPMVGCGCNSAATALCHSGQGLQQAEAADCKTLRDGQCSSV